MSMGKETEETIETPLFIGLIDKATNPALASADLALYL